jgi:acyl-coenzyme A thioesterase PaaI-like protein
MPPPERGALERGCAPQVAGATIGDAPAARRSMDDDLDARIRSGKALSESMGNFHVTGWDPEHRILKAAFTVRREYCHTDGTIAQGGFITAWLDAAMAYAVIHDTGHAQTVFSLEIKVSFYEKVGPGQGWVKARVVRRGKRIAFLDASLYGPDGKLAAEATSTGVLADL